MTKGPLQDTLSELKKLMHGYNYEVSLGIELFENCNSLDDVYAKLKTVYKDIRPGMSQLIACTEAELWEEIDTGLDFRGDRAGGLILSPEEELALKQEQTKYKSYIQQYISNKTKIYCYPDEAGIPFYIVYWGYAFILLNEDMPSLFIYGGASD